MRWQRSEVRQQRIDVARGARAAAAVLDLDLVLDLTPPDPEPTSVTRLRGTSTSVTPLPCRLHLWHRWRVNRVETGVSYTACACCGRLMPRSIFDPVV
jgi:hypothetical protein